MRIDWKKLGLILLFLAALGLFAFFIYWIFIRAISPQTPAENGIASSTNQLPGAGTGNPKIIDNGQGQLTADNQAQLAPFSSSTEAGPNSATILLTPDITHYSTADKNGNIIYYNNETGNFERIGPDGKTAQYGPKTFQNVSNVTWSSTRAKAVLAYADGTQSIYDFTTGKETTIPSHWQDFSFSPNDQQLAFKSIALDPENRFLVVSDSQGGSTKALEPIGGAEDSFIVSWSPNNQMVAEVQKGMDLDRSEIYFVGLNNENFKSMIVEGRDFRGNWSPTGDRLLYSVYSQTNDYKPQLWISYAYGNNIGDNRRRIGLETWADKCTFTGDETVYCAVPASLPAGAGLGPEVADTISDSIYRIDLATGSKKLVATPDSNTSIKTILSQNGNYLTYTDVNNQTYKVPIK